MRLVQHAARRAARLHPIVDVGHAFPGEVGVVLLTRVPQAEREFDIGGVGRDGRDATARLQRNQAGIVIGQLLVDGFQIFRGQVRHGFRIAGHRVPFSTDRTLPSHRRYAVSSARAWSAMARALPVARIPEDCRTTVVVPRAGPTGAALSVPMGAAVVIHRRGITRGISVIHRSARADANRSTIARVRAAIRAASCSVVGYRNRAGRSASGSGPVWPVRPCRSDPFNASGPGRVRSDSQRGESPSVTPGESGAASLVEPATVVSE